MQSSVLEYILPVLFLMVSMLLGVLVVVLLLVIGLNLRRLRNDTQAGLLAIRESIDRLAGVAPAASAEEPPAVSPAATDEAAPESAAQSSESGKIGFSCPECGRFFEGPSTLGGTTYTCPECRIDFHIH